MRKTVFLISSSVITFQAFAIIDPLLCAPNERGAGSLSERPQFLSSGQARRGNLGVTGGSATTHPTRDVEFAVSSNDQGKMPSSMYVRATFSMALKNAAVRRFCIPWYRLLIRPKRT